MTWNPDDWLNLPEELRTRNQWMVCQGIVNKQPLTLSGYPGDPTDSNNWNKFADACVVAAAHPGWYPGFCTSRSDPISIIDLDNKAHSEELKERNLAIARQFNTAMETSMSGWGLHLFVYGNIGNHIGQHVEIWSENHFVALTGLMHQNNAPILNDPELLDSFASSHLFPQHNSVESDSADGPEVEDDVAVCQRIMQSHYANTFRTLVTDSWQQEYPDRSNADYAFACILAEYTPSNQQIWRIFNQTTLGQRYKDGKPRHKDSDLFLSNACVKARMKANAKLAENAMLQNAANVYANGYANGHAQNGHIEQRADIGRPAAAPAASNIFPIKQGIPLRIPRLPEPEQKIWTFDRLNINEVIKEPAPHWAVEMTYESRSVNVLYGWSGIGKSFMLIDLMFKISQGLPWFGHRTEQMNCLFVGLEGGSGMSVRWRALMAANGLTSLPHGIDLYRGDFDLNDERCAEQFIRANENHKGEFIGIDTFARAVLGKDENDNGEMGLALKNAELIQRELDACVSLIHHTTKPSAANWRPDIRGAGAITGNLQGKIEMFKDKEEQCYLHLGKVREGPKGSIYPFNFASYDTGLLDQWGQRVFSQVIVPIEMTPEMEERVITGVEHKPLSTRQNEEREAKKERAGPVKMAIRQAIALEGIHNIGQHGAPPGIACAPRNAVITKAIELHHYKNPSKSKSYITLKLDEMCESGGELGHHTEHGVQWIWVVR